MLEVVPKAAYTVLFFFFLILFSYSCFDWLFFASLCFKLIRFLASSTLLFVSLWGTVPSVGNVAQPPLGKASGEWGWQAGPTSMDKFSSGKSGLHCTLTAMRLALAKTPPPWGSKCLLSIFIFLKSVLNHPSMDGGWAASSLSCNILLFEVISTVLSFVVLKR